MMMSRRAPYQEHRTNYFVRSATQNREWDSEVRDSEMSITSVRLTKYLYQIVIIVKSLWERIPFDVHLHHRYLVQDVQHDMKKQTISRRNIKQ